MMDLGQNGEAMCLLQKNYKECYYYHQKGSFSFEIVFHIDYMIQNNYAILSKYMTDSYGINNNTNKTVNFILENLK